LQTSLNGFQARSAPPVFRASGLAPRAIQPKMAEMARSQHSSGAFVQPGSPLHAPGPFQAFALGGPPVPPRSATDVQSVQRSVAVGQRAFPSTTPGPAIQRKGGPSAVIQRVPCPYCNVEPVPYYVGADLLNGHGVNCPYYQRTFQTVADRQATQNDPHGRLQRSHSFRAPVFTPPLINNGLFVAPVFLGYQRAHQHDNNISGGGPVSHYR
jgi:hypothetical protein